MSLRMVFGILLLSLALAADTARSDETRGAAEGAKFKGGADLPGAVQLVTGFSEDKQAVTVIFRNLQAAVGGTRGPLVDTRVATVSLPMDNKDKSVRITQDVRGFVTAQEGARAVLIVQAAGKTTVVDLKKSRVNDKARTEPEGALKEARDKAKAQAKDYPKRDRLAEGFDFMHRIQGTVPAGGNYQATFLLLVERDTDAGGALLTIDTFDVAIVKSGAK